MGWEFLQRMSGKWGPVRKHRGFVPLWGYFAACIANPVAWFFACFFLIPAYFVVRKRLQKEKDVEKEHDARTANA